MKGSCKGSFFRRLLIKDSCVRAPLRVPFLGGSFKGRECIVPRAMPKLHQVVHLASRCRALRLHQDAGGVEAGHSSPRPSAENAGRPRHGAPDRIGTWQLSSRVVNQKQLASYVKRQFLTDRSLRVVTRKNDCGKGQLSVRLTCSTRVTQVGTL